MMSFSCGLKRKMYAAQSRCLLHNPVIPRCHSRYTQYAMITSSHERQACESDIYMNSEINPDSDGLVTLVLMS